MNPTNDDPGQPVRKRVGRLLAPIDPVGDCRSRTGSPPTSGKSCCIPACERRTRWSWFISDGRDGVDRHRHHRTSRGLMRWLLAEITLGSIRLAIHVAFERPGSAAGTTTPSLRWSQGWPGPACSPQGPYQCIASGEWLLILLGGGSGLAGVIGGISSPQRRYAALWHHPDMHFGAALCAATLISPIPYLYIVGSAKIPFYVPRSLSCCSRTTKPCSTCITPRRKPLAGPSRLA